MNKTHLRLVLTTLLFLVIPICANAWTLTVKVTGGSVTPNNSVVLSGGVSRTITSGTVTVYPSSATKITVNTAAGYGRTATLDGAAAPASPFTLSSGSHTVAVTYSPAPTASLKVTQSPGGTVNVMLPNQTWTSTGATGITVGTGLFYNIGPDGDHAVSSYTINGATTSVNGSTTGQSITGSFNAASGENTISALFRFVARITGSVSAPTNGFTGQAVNCSVQATSNDTGLMYAFAVIDAATGQPEFSGAASSLQTFSFTPTVAKTYLVSAAITSANGGSFTTQPVQVIVTSYESALNGQCISCHSTQSPGIVSDYQASLHKENIGSTCIACHTADTPHSVGINSANVDPVTFEVKNGNIAGMSQGTSFCVKCHSATIVSSFTASRHKVSSVVCSSCHSNGVHNPNFTATACAGCHFDSNGEVANHPLAIGSTPCISCHDPHALAISGGLPGAHFNNVTSGMYPASYVTSRATCSNCHYAADPVNAINRQQWYTSGHARVTGLPWIAYDFKTRSGCVQCHTTTGFIAYSTGKVTAAWGVASDKTKEVLTCIGCHSDMTKGEVRNVRPVLPFADDPYRNRDVGVSNVCMACHSGRNNGASIQAQLSGPADFGNLAFIAPHYLAAGGTLHGKAGYHFPGRTYAFYSSNSHRSIGMGNHNGTGSSGPCVGCHKSSESGHTFATGAIALCSNCHGDSMPPDQLAQKQAAFANGLEVLKAMLEAKGYPYTASYPYFSNTNWGSGQAGADTMGAAFNYLLLLKEPGAFAHNPAYAKQLIVDSIDYLYNGTVTGSIDSALSYLVAQGRITEETKNSMAGYQTSSSCSSCHANTSGSHPAHLNSGFGCADCHNDTVATGTTLIPGNLSHLNGSFDLAAGPGRSFSYVYAPTGGTCSSISCHNGGTAVWGGALGCDGCHDAPPATASHLKHYGGTIAQAGYGSTGIAQDLSPSATAYVMNCGNCHPMDKAKHGDGIVEVELYNPLAPAGSLKALNPATAAYVPGTTLFTDFRGLSYTKGTCSNVYCHSYTEKTSTAIPENDATWESKVTSVRKYRDVTWGGASLTCSGCHGNPTTTSFVNNDGGAGDSHSWMDQYGYQNLHTYNMGYDPISCRYCHNDTVKQVNAFTSDAADVRTLQDVPIANFSKHVNGRNDVAFDKQNPFVYGTYGGFSLSGATYDPATKTCSNVSCHINETQVKWGTPYRWYLYGVECDRCHGYGY